jgi:parallel beta-helix repeat protein
MRRILRRATEGRVEQRLILGVLVFALAACGGGGSSDGGGGGGSAFYVRAAVGSDLNTGLAPDQALATIAQAATLAEDGDTIVVGPGTYAETAIDAPRGTARRPVTFLADTAGTRTGDRAGAVVVAAAGITGFSISGGTYVVLDGFTVTGASGNNAAGILIRSGSDHAAVQNCVVFNNQGDGIRVQSANDVRLFNNLVYGNDRNGVRIAGNPGALRAQLINNTIAANRGRGVFVGSDEAASTGAVLRNNIIQDNIGQNLQVTTGTPDSLPGFDSQFNLVFPPNYRPVSLPVNDINEDARFADAADGDYHLAQSTSPALNAADPDTDAELRDALLGRTTASSGAPDALPLDLGYHYPR